MDPDDGIASVRWTQKEGIPVALSDPASFQPQFMAPAIAEQDQVLVFEITVTDTRGLASQDACVVRVRQKGQPTPPRPDIKINGQDGPMGIAKNSTASVSISLDPGDYRGQILDVWLLVDSPRGRLFYVYGRGWQRTPAPFVQTSVDAIVSYNAFTTRLHKGNYVFYFAIDDNADGILDGTWFDEVLVTTK